MAKRPLPGRLLPGRLLPGLLLPRLLLLACVAAVTALTAWAGLWFVPFAVGVAVGAASLRWRRMVLPAVAGAVAGWALPLWILALRGRPSGATARVIAALAGLPPHAFVTVVVTLGLAALQVWTGAWLARALARAFAPAPAPAHAPATEPASEPAARPANE